MTEGPAARGSALGTFLRHLHRPRRAMVHPDAQDRELVRQTTMLRAIGEKLLSPDEPAALETSFGGVPLASGSPAGQPASGDQPPSAKPTAAQPALW